MTKKANQSLTRSRSEKKNRQSSDAKITAELDKILMKELNITSRAGRRKKKIDKIISG